MPKVNSARLVVLFDKEPMSKEEVRKEMLELIDVSLNVKVEKILKTGFSWEHRFSGEIDLTDYANNPDDMDHEPLRSCNVCFALPGTHADNCPER